MILNVMRYRTGKFGVQVTEISREGKVVNTSEEVKELKVGLSSTCTDFRTSRINGGVNHTWNYDTWKDVSDAFSTVNLNDIEIEVEIGASEPSKDFDSPKDSDSKGDDPTPF